MTKKNAATVQVIWKLPEGLVDECEMQDEKNNWAEGFRTLLKQAASDKYRVMVVVEGPTVSKAMSLPVKVNRYLEREARRLTKETGKSWSTMQVAREIWRQQQFNRKRRAA